MSIIEINAKNERTLKMYSNLIEEIIRSHTDKNKFNTGFSFFKRNLVINDYSKVDGDNITFYATVIDEASIALVDPEGTIFYATPTTPVIVTKTN